MRITYSLMRHLQMRKEPLLYALHFTLYGVRLSQCIVLQYVVFVVRNICFTLLTLRSFFTPERYPFLFFAPSACYPLTGESVLSEWKPNY